MDHNMPMRKHLFVAATLAVGILVTGCASDEIKPGGTPRPKRYSSVISLSPSTSEIFASHFYHVPLIGRTKSCTYPKSIEKAAVICDVKPDYETIKFMHPDVIVYDKALYNESDIAKIKATFTESKILEYSATTVKDYIHQLRVMASEVAGELNVNEYCDKVQRSRASGMANLPRNPVTMIVSGGQGGMMIAGTKTFIADVARSGGADVKGPDSDKWVPLNAEEMLSANPEMIISNDSAFKALLSDPKFASVKAVAATKPLMASLQGGETDPTTKSKLRVIPMEEDLLMRAGGRVYQTIDGISVAVRAILGGAK